MINGDMVVTAFFALLFLGIFTYIVFRLGRESGCEIHEFRIYKVECIKCGRQEDRYKNDVVETRLKSIETPRS